MKIQECVHTVNEINGNDRVCCEAVETRPKWFNPIFGYLFSRKQSEGLNEMMSGTK